MQDSKFWRFAAVLMIAAALYVGHGLHHGVTDAVPSLVNTAHAGEPAAAKDKPAAVPNKEKRTNVLRTELARLKGEQSYAFAIFQVETQELQQALAANREKPNTLPKFEIRRIQLTAERSRLKCDLLKIECELKEIEIEKSTDR